MELKKGKYTIICRHLNGKNEIFETDSYEFADNNQSVVFYDLNNPRFDTVSKKPIPIKLPFLLCKFEGGDTISDKNNKGVSQ